MLAIALLLGVVAIYYIFNPANVKWFPQCPIKFCTGYSCPACGVQRAVHALMHGEFSKALSYNYFFVLSIPYLLLACTAHVLRKRNTGLKFANFLEGKVLAWIYVVCFCVWFIVRNILDI